MEISNNTNNKDLVNKQTSSFKYVDEYISHAKELKQADELLKAIDVLKESENRILTEEISFNNSNNLEYNTSNNNYEKFISNDFVKKTYEDNDLVFKCLDNYKQLNSRDPDRSSNGIDTWFINEDKLNTVTICGRVTLNSTFINMVAVFKEIDLLQKSIDSFNEIKVEKVLSRTRWLASAKIKMPMFVTNRELYLEGFGIFLKEENMIMLPIYSPSESYLDSYGIPKENKGYIRVSMNIGFYCVKYLDEDHCELFGCFNVDPKVAAVPNMILNYITKEFGYYLMRDFKKAAEDSKLVHLYNERINQNSEFYNFIRNALNVKQ